MILTLVRQSFCCPGDPEHLGRNFITAILEFVCMSTKKFPLAFLPLVSLKRKVCQYWHERARKNMVAPLTTVRLH